MKKIVFMLVAMLASACSPLPPQVVDAVPVLQGGVPLHSGMGAIVTGRDWNNQAPDSKGNGDVDGDGKDG